MYNLSTLGESWLLDEIRFTPTELDIPDIVEFNEANRYLPPGVSSISGRISFSLTPYAVEILQCFNPWSPIQDVRWLKGTQIAATTILECIILYNIVGTGTLPCMLLTADNALVRLRRDNYIIPMLKHSNFMSELQSSDTTNARKTGVTLELLQWRKGGSLVLAGAQSPTRYRSASIAVMLQDEIDGYPLIVGDDGDPIALADSRCDTFPDSKKIFRASTPTLEHISKIKPLYLEGDQRKYHVVCQNPDCGHLFEIRWSFFDYSVSNRVLDRDSVRMHCPRCRFAHKEAHKRKLFALESGACWRPTAVSKSRYIRSYHTPAWLAPNTFKQWADCVQDLLDGFDPETKTVIDSGKYQKFYNNVRGEAYEVKGERLKKQQVSDKALSCYSFGQIPNDHAVEHAGGPIQFLVCCVDVHRSNLAVSVYGVTPNRVYYCIEYFRLFAEDPDALSTESIDCEVWENLEAFLLGTRYVDGEGREYGIFVTFVDSGWNTSVVSQFCGAFESSVFPIKGQDKPSGNQKIQQFTFFKSKTGRDGIKITVDVYKDVIAPSLRRKWTEEAGPQPPNHINFPSNITDDQLKELTVEYRKVEGVKNYWHRPGNAPNELFDLTGYTFCAVDFIMYHVCTESLQLDEVNPPVFWQYCVNNPQWFNRIDE